MKVAIGLRRSLKALFYVLIVLLTFGVGDSVYDYFRFSEKVALEWAQEAFVRECSKRNLNPTQFDGPYPQSRVEEKAGFYKFVIFNYQWRSRKDKGLMVVGVDYTGADAWYIPSNYPGCLESRTCGGSERFVQKLGKQVGRLLEYRPQGRPKKAADDE